MGQIAASLFEPLPPVYTPPAVPRRPQIDLLGRLLSFWESSEPGIAAVPPVQPEAPAARQDAACHSAISRRTNRGGAVATAVLARGGRLLKLRMSRKKPLQQVEVGGGTGDLSGVPQVNAVELHTWDDAERIGDNAKRGIISSFSYRSRGRLLDLINSIDQAAAPSERWRFVTLTYHKQDVSPRHSKKHLQSFLKRIDRHFGRSGAIWKIEPQQRGMPHHHLLVLLPADHVADLEAEREWFARAWVEITSGTESQYLVHKYSGDKREAAWQQLESWEHVSGYCGKYVGKVCNVPNESAWAKAGRWWGKVNADLLPIRLETHTFTEDQSYRVQRLMRKAAKAKSRLQGFTVHLPDGEKLRLSASTWTTRKAFRRQGLRVTRQRPWINAGLGGRLYMLESESLRLLAFGVGMRIGWGITSTPSKTVLGFDQTETIPF